MTKSTRLQMSTFSYLMLNSLFRRRTILGLPRGHRRRNRWFLVGSFHTPVPVIRSIALPPNRLRDTLRTRRNTLLEPHVPVVPVRVISTLVWPLAHPHPPSHLVSSLAHAPAPHPRRAVWANCRTSPRLFRVLQPLRELEP